MNELDAKIRTFVEQHPTIVPSIVSERLDETLELLKAGSTVYESTPLKNRNSSYSKRWISGIAAAAVAVTVVVSSPALAASYLAQQAVNHKAYIIWNDHYYYSTGKHVDPSLIGNRIGEVKRVGDWTVKQTGDSNEFVPSSPVFEMKENENKLLVKTSIKNMDYLSAYIELQQGEAVQTQAPDKILSSKNSPDEVGTVVDNITKTSPLFYTFQGIDSRIKVNKADLIKDVGNITYYLVPEADTSINNIHVEGSLFIYQYGKQNQTKISQSKFNPSQIKVPLDGGNKIQTMDDPKYIPPKATETFVMNGIEWNYYSDQLLRGTKEDTFYEVQTQGNFSEQLLKDLLQYFKPQK
ncbi:hypothetical protein [Paenibacillus sp. 1P03SA]|uniref:hypothetical protein n=1 Tax=Paenibacillus sp. 1P03SA TaxID=3132294 RepID=UPI0039A3D67C